MSYTLETIKPGDYSDVRNLWFHQLLLLSAMIISPALTPGPQPSSGSSHMLPIILLVTRRHISFFLVFCSRLTQGHMSEFSRASRGCGSVWKCPAPAGRARSGSLSYRALSVLGVSASSTGPWCCPWAWPLPFPGPPSFRVWSGAAATVICCHPSTPQPLWLPSPAWRCFCL